MSIVRLRPVLHQPPRENPRFPPHEPRRSKILCSIRYPKNFFPVSRGLSNNCGRKALRIVRAGLAPTPSLADAAETDVLFSETFPFKRTQTVEGKISVRLDPTDGKGSRWRLAVGCNLEGKWVLHWGVTFCDDLGSEWDQPPPEMRPPGSIPIKDYAIETPLKKSSSALGGQILHEVHIDFDRNSAIAAIHFVLKEEETGAWFQHKGRDFRISLKDFIEEDNASGGKQGFSIWLG